MQVAPCSVYVRHPCAHEVEHPSGPLGHTSQKLTSHIRSQITHLITHHTLQLRDESDPEPLFATDVQYHGQPVRQALHVLPVLPVLPCHSHT